MTANGSEDTRADRFGRVRTVKNALFGLQIASVMLLSGYLVYNSGFSRDPLHVPLGRVLNLLLLAAVLLSIENMVFRALEIKHARRRGQRFLIAESSWRGAKRALIVALIIAIVLIVPAARTTTMNLLSQTSRKPLDLGESFSVSFYNQDFLGITRVQEVAVTVISGSLRITLQEGDRVVNPGGTNLSGGEQGVFEILSSSYLTYTLIFQNVANDTTIFTFRILVGFPPELTSLVVALSLLVVVSNSIWMGYLRSKRKSFVGEGSLPGPAAWSYQQPPPPTWHAERPWYEIQGLYQSVYTPWRPAPPRSSQPPRREPMAQELPPPPPQVEPYEVEVPPPPPEEPAEDETRGLLSEVAPNVPALMEKAEERAASGNYQEALEDLDTILQFDGRNLRALMRKADLLQRLRRPADALECLDEVLRVDPWHQKALLIRGQILEEEGRHDEALGCYETILSGGPTYIEALVRKGDIMVRMGEADIALEIFREALRLKPDDPAIEERVRVLIEQHEDPMDRARREIEAGNFQEAERALLRAIEGESRREAMETLADLYLTTAREEEAARLLDELIEMEPDNPSLLLKRAKALARRGRLADALESCGRACELLPEDAYVWSLKGGLEADLGLETKAEESLSRALQLNPEDAEARARLEAIRRSRDQRLALEELLRGIDGITEEAIGSILEKYSSAQELKGAKVKTLAALPGMEEELAKRILKKVRKGR